MKMDTINIAIANREPNVSSTSTSPENIAAGEIFSDQTCDKTNTSEINNAAKAIAA